MFTVHHYPRKISKFQLDQYLSQGWFRMGQSIFTCHFLYVQDDVYSTVWIRLNLHDHRYSKSQRKLVRRVEEDFKVRVQKAVFDEEKERLYDKYKIRFMEPVADSISTSLQNDLNQNIYDTYEVTVHEGDRLIAASFFDLGAKSSASIMGIYDPDYQKYSLGYYTMLREIAFSKKTGRDYYYPGYVVPGYERFDYKLRIGHVEYFLPESHSWKFYKEEEINTLHSEKLKEKMRDILWEFSNWNIPAEMMFFPSPPIFFSLTDSAFISSPLCILCHQANDDYPLMIDYDSGKDIFRLYRAGIVLKLLHQSSEKGVIVNEVLKCYPDDGE